MRGESARLIGCGTTSGRYSSATAAAVDLLLIGLLARGHVLIEDVPGVGKTVLAKSLARSIDCKFSRIQLTPDLLPSDVLGVSIFNKQTQQFDFKPGPIFANIVLADEINRTTPRTQSALLEAMSEEQVSVENQTLPLRAAVHGGGDAESVRVRGHVLSAGEPARPVHPARSPSAIPSAPAEHRILTTQPGRNALDQLQPVMTRQRGGRAAGQRARR